MSKVAASKERVKIESFLTSHKLCGIMEKSYFTWKSIKVFTCPVKKFRSFFCHQLEESGGS